MAFASTSDDPSNRGACGNVCASGTYLAGACGGHTDANLASRHDSGLHDARATDGTLRDGVRRDGKMDATPDGPRRDGETTDAARTDSRRRDAAPADGQAPDGASVDACVPPYDTPERCGTCEAACSASDVCSPVADAGADGGAFACLPLCASSLEDCDGVCVDETSDPDNCGACDSARPSGICVNSLWQGITGGGVVIIGHDYAAPVIRVSEARLLSNAVFLAPTNPLRVLSFEQYANPTQVAHVKATLAGNAPVGRTLVCTVSNDYTAVGNQLGTLVFDVFLVCDQPEAPAGDPGKVGGSLATALSTYGDAGGDIVVLDGASGPVKEMTSFLSMANLLQTTADTPLPAHDELAVVAHGDAVGNFVVSPYAPIADTVSFTTSETNGAGVTYVVEETAGLRPVVIHKIPSP